MYSTWPCTCECDVGRALEGSQLPHSAPVIGPSSYRTDHAQSLLYCSHSGPGIRMNICYRSQLLGASAQRTSALGRSACGVLGA